MGKDSVLLLVDQRARDSIGILLIYYFLKSMKIDVHLCNKRNMLQKYEYYKPKVVAFSDTSSYFANWCRYMSKKSHIVLIPQEDAIPYKEFTLKRFQWDSARYKPFLKAVSKVFLWGRQSADWLIQEGVYNEEQIVISGTPRTDIYRVISKICPPRKGERFCIGIAPRAEQVNMVHDNMIRRIDSSKYTEGGVIAYTGEDRNWEDCIWHVVAQLRYLFILIDKLSQGENNRIFYRPDPFENYKSYIHLTKKYPNFILSLTPVLAYFLSDIDMLITENSSTGIEALMLKKPVISIQKIIGPRLLDHDYRRHQINNKLMQFYWQPKSIDEALGLIEKYKRGELPFTPDVQGLKDYHKIYYDLPRQEPSSLTIAREITALMQRSINISYDEEIENQSQEKPVNFSKRFAFLRKDEYRHIFLQYYLFDLYYLITDIYRRRLFQMLRSEFYSFHLYDFIQAKKIWNLLKGNS